MNFSQVNSNMKIPILLNRRSAVILKDESRYNWKHSITARRTDKFLNHTLRREKRISLTFRNVILN